MAVMWIVIVVVGLVLVAGVWAYNGISRRRGRMKAAWVQVDIELKRRHTLIADLVNAVATFATEEDPQCRAVVEARMAAIIAGTTGQPARISTAENVVSDLVHGLSANIVQRRLALSTAGSFTVIQRELTGSDERLGAAREEFNVAVQTYNTAVRRFPLVVIARIYGFRPVGDFRADAPAGLDLGHRDVPAPRLDSVALASARAR
jgi:LemA protein